MKSADQSYAAFVGIDWADQKHDVCLKAAGSDGFERSVIAHRPEAIERWAHGLRERFAGEPIAVCLEIARGPLVSALQRYEFLVLFPVNASTLASYRSTFCVSGAKDDPTDAELVLELLLRHPEKLPVLQPQSAAMRKLEKLVEQRRMLVDEVRRVTNRMSASLKEYFPQVLEWFKDKDTLVFCDFVSRWPTLKQAQRARRARLCAFFHEHNVRYRHVVEQRVQSIMAASPLTADPAVIEPNRLLVVSLAQQLRVLLQSVERFDAEIAAVAPTLPDYDLFAGLPGAGPVFAPRLLAAFGEQRETLRKCQSDAELRGRGAGYRTQWQQVLGALAIALPEVHAADLRGMGRTLHPILLLGRRILPSATRQGLIASGRATCARL
jgi:transposase